MFLFSTGRYFIYNYSLGYETDAKDVALRYIKSFTFIIDILSLLPLEILAAGMNDSNLNWAIAFKLNRLLKLWKVSHKMEATCTLICR